MAKPGRATQAKRSRELAKLDKRKGKEERRAQRKEEKSQEGTTPGAPASDVDPDIAHIVPGPQPKLED